MKGLFSLFGLIKVYVFIEDIAKGILFLLTILKILFTAGKSLLTRVFSSPKPEAIVNGIVIPAPGKEIK
jgi:exosortase/archaeosortase